MSWNGDYEDDDYEEPPDEDEAPEDEDTCELCGRPFCGQCGACHNCERNMQDWGMQILKCEQRQRDSIPEELRVSEGL